MLMFKERVGAVIIYLYLQLHRYRAKGGDLNSLIEQGKKEGTQYVQQISEKIPESVTNATCSARDVLLSTAESAKDALKNPAQTAGEVVEKVSDRIVVVATTARDALTGDNKNTEAVKEAVKGTIDTAKGEVRGAIEQGKKK
jgi:hypothetical protein